MVKFLNHLVDAVVIVLICPFGWIGLAFLALLIKVIRG
jgi:hypothetical protein